MGIYNPFYNKCKKKFLEFLFPFLNYKHWIERVLCKPTLNSIIWNKDVTDGTFAMATVFMLYSPLFCFVLNWTVKVKVWSVRMMKQHMIKTSKCTSHWVKCKYYTHIHGTAERHTRYCVLQITKRYTGSHWGVVDIIYTHIIPKNAMLCRVLCCAYT